MRTNVKRFIYGAIMLSIIVIAILLKVDVMSILFTIATLTSIVIYIYRLKIYKFIKLIFYKSLVLYLDLKLTIFGKLSSYINKAAIKSFNSKNNYLKKS